MKRFVEGECRDQSTLFPGTLDEYIGDDNPVRVIDVFVDQLNLGELGFDGVCLRRRDVLLTIQPVCSRYTFTGISTAFSPAAD